MLLWDWSWRLYKVLKWWFSIMHIKLSLSVVTYRLVRLHVVLPDTVERRCYYYIMRCCFPAQGRLEVKCTEITAPNRCTSWDGNCCLNWKSSCSTYRYSFVHVKMARLSMRACMCVCVCLWSLRLDYYHTFPVLRIFSLRFRFGQSKEEFLVLSEDNFSFLTDSNTVFTLFKLF